MLTALAAFALVGAGAHASAQLPFTPLSGRSIPGEEGALSNDSFLGASVSLEEELARGDDALVRARATKLGADRKREELAAFEAWHRALRTSESGDRVRYLPGSNGWEDPDGVWANRLVEGIEESVVRRIAGLSPEESAHWRSHFSPASDALLPANLSAQTRPTLIEVERLYPGTPAALRAALLLGDEGFESGRPELARTWWRRAQRHAELGDQDPDSQNDGTVQGFRMALARRMDALPDDPTSPAAPLQEPNSLELKHVVELPGANSPARPRGSRSAPGRGLRPGLTWLSDGRIAIQRAEDIVLVDPERGTQGGEFETSAILEAGGLPGVRLENWTAPGTPGWGLRPSADARQLFAVLGRARRLRGNVLAAIRPPLSPAQRGPLTRPEEAFARINWAVTGTVHVANGVESRPAELNDWDRAEFQPGVQIQGSALLAQVRLPDDPVGGHVIALDRRTGLPLWRTFLAQGADLVPSGGRNQRDRKMALAAEPLAVADGRVFAGTHLGTISALDAGDGRILWSLKSRRRSLLDPGWISSGPVPSHSAGSPEGAAAILWAPHDSDRLYWLRGQPLGALSPFLIAPQRLGESEILVGGDAGSGVALGRSGPYRTLTEWRASDSHRMDSFYLAPRERFGTAAALTSKRALFATDRSLYLVDRERELYLIDSVELPADTTTAHGTLLLRGARAALLAGDRLLLFQLR